MFAIFVLFVPADVKAALGRLLFPRLQAAGRCFSAAAALQGVRGGMGLWLRLAAEEDERVGAADSDSSGLAAAGSQRRRGLRHSAQTAARGERSTSNMTLSLLSRRIVWLMVFSFTEQVFLVRKVLQRKILSVRLDKDQSENPISHFNVRESQYCKSLLLAPLRKKLRSANRKMFHCFYSSPQSSVHSESVAHATSCPPLH